MCVRALEVKCDRIVDCRRPISYERGRGLCHAGRTDVCGWSYRRLVEHGAGTSLVGGWFGRPPGERCPMCET
jgi:hypothetical protein